jgi:hypothetical protein
MSVVQVGDAGTGMQGRDRRDPSVETNELRDNLAPAFHVLLHSVGRELITRVGTSYCAVPSYHICK